MTGTLIRITADGKNIGPIYPEGWLCWDGADTEGCGPKVSNNPKNRGWWYATTTGTYEWGGTVYDAEPSGPMLWVKIK
jgi:hypothetical protein